MKPAIAVGLAVLLGAACSDADDTSDPSGGAVASIISGIPESPDRAQYLAIADQLCADLGSGNEIGEPVDGTASIGQIDAQYDAIDLRIARLRALPIPDGDEDTINGILQAYERVLTGLDELRTAVDAEDGQAAVVVTAALGGLRSDVNELVMSFGIDACHL